MKNLLSKSKANIWWYDDDDNRLEDGSLPPGLRGDVSGLRGDVSGLRGDVSGLSGYVSGLRGDVSGLRGDVDDCEITIEERLATVYVSQLVATEEAKAA